jgi:hypothetical protein
MRKSMIATVGMICLSGLLWAANAPAPVQKAFQQKFPKAEKVSWEKENDKEYEANFLLNGVKLSANFTNEGKWLETETEIVVNALPAVVSAGISKSHPKAKIVGASRIETPEGIRYEADLKTGLMKKEVLFNEQGQQIK